MKTIQKRMIALALLSLCGAWGVWGQSASRKVTTAQRHCVLTVNPLEKYTGTASALNGNATPALRAVDYGDGFGGLGQRVRLGVTPSGRDLVERYSYDALGRESAVMLPVPGEGTDNLIPRLDLLGQARTYYGQQRVERTQTYEPSLRNLPLEAEAAGDAWADKPVSLTYAVNRNDAAELAAVRYAVKADGTLENKGNYPAGSLKVTCTADEDGKRSWEFTDGKDRTVLLRTQSAAGVYEDTYYVYDLFDNLHFVLTPEYQRSGDLQKHAYEYRFDDRDRMTAARRPGEDFTRYYRDRSDRVAFSQTGVQQAAGRYTFYLYDPFGRLCVQGECTGANTAAAAQTVVTTSFSGSGDGVGGTGYACALTLGSPEVQLAHYYDTYAFTSLAGFSALPALSGQADATGYLTGTRLRAEGSEDYVYLVNGYDVKGRLTQAVQGNLLGGHDVTSTVYTFTGKPAVVSHTHTASGKPEVTEVTTYTYDHAERLTKVEHTLGGVTVTLVSNTYDELGRLQSKTPHGLEANRQTYTYNIRDWLTGIGGKFTQTLQYNDGATPCYNGNISGMTWKANTETTTHGYQFSYDNLNRMLDAIYSDGSNADRFTEKVTGYDRNGNILSLQRYGQTGASSYGLIDDLTFTLNGNQLNRVDDASTATAYNNGFEFKDAVKQENEYAYDANGNLTKDLNRNISEIKYNFLNLPNKVVFADGSTIEYVYAADGTKLRTKHVINGTTTTTDYCGNVVYENGVQKLLLTEEGYVTLADKQYHYFLKDHQGNNRMVVNASGTVEEVNHYYPFGGVFASSGNAQPYKYNGKELDTENGLNWYDYGARMYNPALGRFTTLDPMAEEYYDISLYAYCGNNPIRFIDSNGMNFGPGDLFRTPRAAALDWGMYYNGASIIYKKEMGSSIYEVKKDGKIIGYSYSPAAVYQEHKAGFSLPPKGENSVGSIHSHGNYTGNIKDSAGNIRKVHDNRFSSADKIFNKKSNLTGFLATPNGSLLEHNPQTGQISVLSTDLPSDPVDPTRKNNIKPTLQPYEPSFVTKIKKWFNDFFTRK